MTSLARLLQSLGVSGTFSTRLTCVMLCNRVRSCGQMEFVGIDYSASSARLSGITVTTR